MVCYICGKPASARCSGCARYLCKDHTVSEGYQNTTRCPECSAAHTIRLKSYKDPKEREKEEISRWSEKRKCNFCGAPDVFAKGITPSCMSPYGATAPLEDDFWWTNRRCGTCKKYFCPNCGTVTELRGTRLDFPQDNVFVWRRCRQHKEKFRPLHELGVLPAILYSIVPKSDTDPDLFELPDEHREH
jgi:hypothetical protein